MCPNRTLLLPRERRCLSPALSRLLAVSAEGEALLGGPGDLYTRMAGPAPGSPDAGAWPSFAYGLRIAASHGTSDSFSAILRIGRALLHGFIQALFHPQAASVEQLTEEDISVEQQSGEDVVDSDRVTSLKDCMLRIWQELSSNPEIASMTESVSGDNPLNVLAEVSEHTFETGINWGRIVVFFYFSYKVIAKRQTQLYC
ncbi:apoptosis regulator BAX-like isoform X3 [Rhineura floridana]|uniref:apoptosis regulator BAX-like isoform X3 n=1 Tax=Rhineura floridana TaxID=261503 RepID=UPI002AC887F4|nr:apoptosis regulator BAX-like isoform X3 [Rhineura floridana]